MTQLKSFGSGIVAIFCIAVVFGSGCGKTESDQNAQVDSKTPNQVKENTTDGTAADITDQVQSPMPAAQLSAQPPGPAPAGKVWSPEHGHWHDTSESASGVVYDGQ